MVDIALCQEFIGYTSSTEAYALRIRLTANEEAPPSGTDPDVVLEAGEVAEVAADDVHDSSMAWGEDPKMVAFEFESSGEASSGSSLYSVPVSFKSHPSADAGVQHKEILGPLSVADQGVHGASECGYWVSSCDCYLYTSVRDSGLSIHTLYAESSAEPSAEHPWTALPALLARKLCAHRGPAGCAVVGIVGIVCRMVLASRTPALPPPPHPRNPPLSVLTPRCACFGVGAAATRLAGRCCRPTPNGLPTCATGCRPTASPTGRRLCTSPFGSILTILTILSWICAGMYICGALPSPACA